MAVAVVVVTAGVRFGGQRVRGHLDGWDGIGIEQFLPDPFQDHVLARQRTFVDGFQERSHGDETEFVAAVAVAVAVVATSVALPAVAIPAAAPLRRTATATAPADFFLEQNGQDSTFEWDLQFVAHIQKVVVTKGFVPRLAKFKPHTVQSLQRRGRFASFFAVQGGQIFQGGEECFTIARIRDDQIECFECPFAGGRRSGRTGGR